MKIELDEDEQRIIIEALKFWFEKSPDNEEVFNSRVHDYLTCNSLIETISEAS